MLDSSEPPPATFSRPSPGRPAHYRLLASDTNGSGPGRQSRPDTESETARSDAPLRVLIVEDETIICMELEHMLAEAGCEVVGAAMSAESAVRLAEAERPDFVTMDIRLSGSRDGVDAAVEIFQRLGIRSIFISAFGDPETIQRARAAQPLAWLRKPLARSQLQKTLSDLFPDAQPD